MTAQLPREVGQGPDLAPLGTPAPILQLRDELLTRRRRSRPHRGEVMAHCIHGPQDIRFWQHFGKPGPLVPMEQCFIAARPQRAAGCRASRHRIHTTVASKASPTSDTRDDCCAAPRRRSAVPAGRCWCSRPAAIAPIPLTGHHAGQHAEEHGELFRSILRACWLGFVGPTRSPIPNTASGRSTCTRRGSTFHQTSKANDPHRNRAPLSTAPSTRQERIRPLQRRMRTH